jgi:hypothetical protein
MWHKYFTENVKNIPTREYLVTRILPRPRDIVYLVKAAVSFAVNRKHERVEERDILDGEMQYSQYAWDSILVENSSSIPKLEEVLLQFTGGPSVVTESSARQFISTLGVAAEEVDSVIRQLINLTFFGLEVAHGKFAYADEKKELQRNAALAAKFSAQNLSETRYEINAPFRTYLEVDESARMMPF